MADFPPKKNTAYTFVFPLWTSAGEFFSGATISATQISKDGGAYAATTNLAVEIGTSGTYSLTLTAAEMNADRIDGRIVVTSAPDLFYTIETVTRQLVDLTVRLIKNTALSNFEFLMVDSADHVSPKTGLTFSLGQSQVSLDGAAFANTVNLPTELANGIYKVNLAAADTNADVLTLKFSPAGADVRYITIVTQP